MSRPLRASEPAAERLGLRLTPTERERVQEAARVNHQRLSDFVRDAIASASDDCLDDEQRRRIRRT